MGCRISGFRIYGLGFRVEAVIPSRKPMRVSRLLPVRGIIQGIITLHSRHFWINQADIPETLKS